MKQARYLIMMMMFLATCFAAIAQHDTLYIKKSKGNTKNDTLYVYGNKLVVNDSLGPNHKVIFIKDSLAFARGGGEINRYLTQAYSINDSVYKSLAKAYQTNGEVFYLDKSVFKRQDSIFRSQGQIFRKQDSVFKRQSELFRQQDSIFRKNDKTYKKNEKVYRKKNDEFRTMDSLRALKWHSDSVRIKVQLSDLKTQLQRLKSDSVRVTRGETKSVSIEVNCKKDGSINISGLSRKIIVRTFNENKVKIVTNVTAIPGYDLSDIDWAKALNIDIEEDKQGVSIKGNNKVYATGGSGAIKTVSAGSSASTSSSSSSGYATVVASGDARMYVINSRSPLEIYVPAKAHVKIDSRYNEVAILDNLFSIDATMLNANLKMEDAQKAIINSKYGSVKAGTIREAQLDLLNCKFTSDDIDQIKINSKYSTVTFDNSRVIDVKSVSDQYQMKSVGSITINKQFGKLNIALLSDSIVLTGTSADISIGAIEVSARFVKIDNKYADMKLPLKDLKNYSLKFDGKYSNVWAGSEKLNINPADSMFSSSPNLTRTAGNLAKQHTIFNVNCTSCSVDFR